MSQKSKKRIEKTILSSRGDENLMEDRHKIQGRRQGRASQRRVMMPIEKRVGIIILTGWKRKCKKNLVERKPDDKRAEKSRVPSNKETGRKVQVYD